MLPFVVLAVALLSGVQRQTSPSHQPVPQQRRSQDATSDHSPEFPKDLDAWLRDGEHQDVPWKVRLAKPILTFQQRQVVRAEARLDAATLQTKSISRHLLFIIKVADSTGTWFPGSNFVTQDFDQPLGHSSDVQLQSEVILRPGKYTIATIMYDSVTGEHDVSFLPVEISPPKGDALPDLLNNIPDAEFVRGDIKGEDSFSAERPDLSLHNHRPLQLEILIDLSTREHQFKAAFPPTFSGTIRDLPFPPHFRRLHDNSYSIRLLQTASVLGALTPNAGCVVVSSFDAMKEKTMLPPTPANNVDWLKLRDLQLGPEKDTISVSALGARKDLAPFLQRQFNALSHAPNCAASGQKPLHVVLVLSHGLQLPEGSHKVRLEACDCTVFYLRQADTAINSDDLKGILSPLSPRSFQFDKPEQFRLTLAELLSEIERLAQ